jgi:hypothetical protein
VLITCRWDAIDLLVEVFTRICVENVVRIFGLLRLRNCRSYIAIGNGGDRFGEVSRIPMFKNCLLDTEFYASSHDKKR